jgi:HD-GYP domain-containing protein (c-di-GMP phosphodiesterase class II)
MVSRKIASLPHQNPALSARLEGIHTTIIQKFNSIDRIACALYDPKTDLLKTFINSTHQGKNIASYEYKLSDSVSLSHLAASGTCRVIDDIHGTFEPATEHSSWLLSQNYNSSFTIPMVNGENFLGFVFFDSLETKAFNEVLQRDLLLYSNLITMAISSEVFAVNSLLATAAAVRSFSNLRDFETGLHLDRMALFSRLIGKEVSMYYQLTDDFVEHLYLFAPLHDLGKIGIPDEILLKPGKLTPEERTVMHSHVDKGVTILNKVLDGFGIAHLPDSKIMQNIVACHHELLDGSGYPNKLAGEQIPIETRIVTVADIFDSLTSTRPYKKPWSVADAILELERMVAQGQLDRVCVNALKKCRLEAEKIISEFADRDL